MREEFKVELKVDNFSLTKPFFLFVLAAISGVYIYQNQTSNPYFWLLFLIPVLIFLSGVYFATEQSFLSFNGSDVILMKSNLGMCKYKYYDIKKIENLELNTHVKSNVSMASAHIRVLGMDVTPESMMDYYYHKEVLSFYYEGKKIEIGKWKKAFDGKKLADVIKNKMS